MAIFVEGEHALGAHQVHALLRIWKGVLYPDAIVLLHSIKELVGLRIQSASVQAAEQAITACADYVAGVGLHSKSRRVGSQSEQSVHYLLATMEEPCISSLSPTNMYMKKFTCRPPQCMSNLRWACGRSETRKSVGTGRGTQSTHGIKNISAQTGTSSKQPN